ncbi:peptidase [Phormidium sp. CLA17]|uniref:matrixin family metalloprotease n=1 Tax=Leptolyngbya sp. Cla-17 TaxID=2803751 RepID=UPI0018D84B1C|nr:matrixin family metalloprotease [Leptolyngbya sp. Cla-17]MBM0743106.1 peptidase [Leptolyngbya sp. Cla-17]
MGSNRKRSVWFGRSLLGGAIAFVISLVVVVMGQPILSAQPSAALGTLPAAQIHPIPPTLAQWRDPQQSGDYFDQVQAVVVNYLIWSTFPVTVYVEPPTVAEQANPFTAKQAKTWGTAVEKAVQEWHRYLPLKQVEQAGDADIRIARSPLPLRFDRSNQDGEQRKLPILRARSAETRFELYAKKPTVAPSDHSILSHRVTVYIRPDQASEYLQASARHELGHALGIWGHSPQQTDALYFSQVRNPAKISARDLNTLKRVYEQPTRLGWMLAK